MNIGCQSCFACCANCDVVTVYLITRCLLLTLMARHGCGGIGIQYDVSIVSHEGNAAHTILLKSI